ncbi:MAG: hypothetical protein L3J39_14860 [Verrucomicrobiales bacterium]|nr:hypothetical protein [Verrucomicrobiales bacterium]
MKRVVLAIAILCMAVAAFFGVTNKQTRDNDILERDEAKQEYGVTNDKLNVKEKELADAKVSRQTAQDAKDQTSAELSALAQSLKRQESTIAKSKEELAKIDIQQKEIDLAVKKLDGITSVAELIEKEKALQDTLAEKKVAKAESDKKLVASTKLEKVVETQVRTLEKNQIERAKTIALNGLEATVVAVNKDWGFVMVNAGMALGVSGSSSLLVKRGEELIARLRIVTLAPDMVVCDVVADSVAKGARVMPGDKVIFEAN